VRYNFTCSLDYRLYKEFCYMIKLGRAMRELCSVCEEIRNIHKILVRNLDDLSIHARAGENVWVI